MSQRPQLRRPGNSGALGGGGQQRVSGADQDCYALTCSSSFAPALASSLYRNNIGQADYCGPEARRHFITGDSAVEDNRMMNREHERGNEKYYLPKNNTFHSHSFREGYPPNCSHLPPLSDVSQFRRVLFADDRHSYGKEAGKAMVNSSEWCQQRSSHCIDCGQIAWNANGAYDGSDMRRMSLSASQFCQQSAASSERHPWHSVLTEHLPHLQRYASTAASSVASYSGASTERSSPWGREQEEDPDDEVDDELVAAWERASFASSSSRSCYSPYTTSPSYTSLSRSSSISRSPSTCSPIHDGYQEFRCPRMHPHQQPNSQSALQETQEDVRFQTRSSNPASDATSAPALHFFGRDKDRATGQAKLLPSLSSQLSFNPQFKKFQQAPSLFASRSPADELQNTCGDRMHIQFHSPAQTQTEQRRSHWLSRQTMERKDLHNHQGCHPNKDAQRRTGTVNRDNIPLLASHYRAGLAEAKVNNGMGEKATETSDFIVGSKSTASSRQRNVSDASLTDSLSSSWTLTPCSSLESAPIPKEILSSTPPTSSLKRRKKRCCSAEGCTRQVKKNGVCLTHGAKVTRPRCKVEGCGKQAQNKGLCIAHGAVVKRCKVEGCTNCRLKGGLCIQHGADVIRCKVKGCPRHTQKGGLCVRHGAVVPRCRASGCTSQARKGRLCRRHKNYSDLDQHNASTRGTVPSHPTPTTPAPNSVGASSERANTLTLVTAVV